MSMYTDPNHIHVNDPGQVEGNMVFTYLDVFGTEKEKIAELKEHYTRGGLGDVKIKRYLIDVLEAEFAPIRERREAFAKDPGEVMNLLKIGSEKALGFVPALVFDLLQRGLLKLGSEKAEQVAAQTLAEVKNAMGINYFA